jgi:hypothetical protein
MRKPTRIILVSGQPLCFHPRHVGYYIHLNQQTSGPFSEDEIRTKLRDGQIEKSTLVAKEGDTGWVPLSQTGLAESKTDAITSPASDLQFDHAEFAQPKSGAVMCSVCKKPVHDSYYHINRLVACGPCKERIELSGAGRFAMNRFGISALFGVGAAIGGAVIWYAVRELTHAEWGLISIAVGYLVGLAVRKGSRGWGGWQYQTLAVGLTYLSIAGAYIPVLLSALTSEGREISASLLIYAAAFACVVPFMGGASNFLGWIIIAIALYQAWKMNRRVPLEITGPYKIAPAPSQ